MKTQSTKIAKKLSLKKQTVRLLKQGMHQQGQAKSPTLGCTVSCPPC